MCVYAYSHEANLERLNGPRTPVRKACLHPSLDKGSKIMAVQIRFLHAVLPLSLQRSQEEASKGSLWLTRNRLVTSSIQANSAECASQGGTKGTDLYTQ